MGGFVTNRNWERLSQDLPQFLQTLNLGMEAEGRFMSLMRFGPADDHLGLERGRSQAWHWSRSDDDIHGWDKAHVYAWVSDGTSDYFGPFIRPTTPYDFRLRLYLDKHCITAWVSGRGDDDWFLVVEDAPLPYGILRIDRMRTSMYPEAPRIEKLLVRTSAWAPVEVLQKHSLTKPERVVIRNKGFKYLAMRSTWCKQGKHVTIFRNPEVHAAFTDVSQAGPNHLVCVWRNGSHTAGTGGLSFAYSDNLEKTWSDEILVTDLKVKTP